MSEEVELKEIKMLAIVSSILGAVYIALGFCSIIAKLSGSCASTLTPEDLGLGILMVSIGAILFSAGPTLRSNIVLSTAATLIGIGLAVGAMFIQLISLGASWLDGIIVGEPLSKEELVSGVLRGDTVLGYIALPFLPIIVKAVKGKVVR